VSKKHEPDTPNSDSNTLDRALEFDENATEDAPLLKTDAHIIPLEKLVERFNSNLTTGLTNDTVTQHRATFGQNKLTPSRPPSLLWMLIKQLLIGFNGILWIATLFAFLSYVSFLYCFSFKKIHGRITLKHNELFTVLETFRRTQSGCI
jgi:magnesium-transporting ATPase (P-type)